MWIIFVVVALGLGLLILSNIEKRLEFLETELSQLKGEKKEFGVPTAVQTAIDLYLGRDATRKVETIE